MLSTRPTAWVNERSTSLDVFDAYLGSESMLEKFCIHFCYLRLGLIEVANEVRLVITKLVCYFY